MSMAGRQQCRRCVMDSSAPDLDLDASGLCRYCRHFDSIIRSHEYAPERLEANRKRLLEDVRRAGRGQRYDCVLGLSGGADSSYAAWLAREEGLRPVAVHVDNGWDTELAVMNIESIVRKLDVDLVTWVIDWAEFRELQLSLLRAGVVDLELVSDHAIIAGLYRTARRFGVRYILSGDNHATESTLPQGWNHPKTDLTNIRAINAAFSKTSLRTYPKLSTLEMVFSQRVLHIRNVPFLSYYPYVKSDAIALLAKQVGWRPYGGKHHESVITRFYQGYILPRKFGIDKRRLHLSRLICSGQMTREEALKDLEQPQYDPALQMDDREYVCKKFRISVEEFDRLMSAPPRSHFEFSSDRSMMNALFKVRSVTLKAIGRVRGLR